MSAASAQALIAELQRKAYFEPQVAVQVQPLFLSPQTTQVRTSSYVRAFEDARSKAEALASRTGKHLLPAPRDVTEELTPGLSYTGANAAPPGGKLALQAMRVNAASNQPIILAVTFGVVGDPGRTISVFGLSDSATQPNSMRTADGLEVDLNARGTDVPAAANSLRTADALVRRVASQYGALGQSVSVTSSTFGSY